MTCCFTGYRPEKFSFDFSPDNKYYTNFENSLISAVFSAAVNGYSVFYSGVARGFDLLAAETVLMLKRSGRAVALKCVLPYRNQSDGWDDEWRARYLNVLKNADEIIILSEDYHRGCFDARNRYMIEHSQTVITYFDGVKGGTASTLKMAEKGGLKIINIADEFSQMSLF